MPRVRISECLHRRLTGLSLLADIIIYRNAVKALKVKDAVIHGFGNVIRVQCVNITLRSGPLTERRRYKNPPIEEALCEFGFAPGPDWDPTIPGKLQAELGDAYSGKPGEQKAVQVGLTNAERQASQLAV